MTISCNKLEKNKNDGRDSFWKEKTGEKPIKDKSYVGNFEKISVSNGLTANIYKSDEDRVVVSAPEDILDKIIVKFTNNKVDVSVDNKSNWLKSVSTKKILVKIYVSKINGLNADSAAEITLKDAFEGQELTLNADSSASIYGNFTYDKIIANADSSGKIIGKIFADTASLKVDSSGTMKLEGKISKGNLNADSGGDLFAENVEMIDGEINSSSGGDVTIKVSGKISASSDSGASIRLKKIGEPVISKSTDSGGSVDIK